MDELKKEALEKSMNFHNYIENDEGLSELLMDCEEWHQFREAMIRLSLS